MKRSLIIPVFLLSGMCLAAGCGSKNNVDLSSAHTTEAETMAQTDEPEPETEETEEPASQAEGSSRPDSPISNIAVEPGSRAHSLQDCIRFPTIYRTACTAPFGGGKNLPS